MSDNNGDPFAEATRQFTQGQSQFLKMWTDFAGKMGGAGVSFSPESTPPDVAKEMRATFFKALSEYCDQYMRSPAFLDSWKKAMDGAIDFRRQMNESASMANVAYRSICLGRSCPWSALQLPCLFQELALHRLS